MRKGFYSDSKSKASKLLLNCWSSTTESIATTINKNKRPIQNAKRGHNQQTCQGCDEEWSLWGGWRQLLGPVYDDTVVNIDQCGWGYILRLLLAAAREYPWRLACFLLNSNHHKVTYIHTCILIILYRNVPRRRSELLFWTIGTINGLQDSDVINTST